MAVPKQKTSRGKRNHRRSHHKIVAKEHSECNNCRALKISHHLCSNCGFYKGKQIIIIKQK